MRIMDAQPLFIVPVIPMSGKYVDDDIERVRFLEQFGLVYVLSHCAEFPYRSARTHLIHRTGMPGGWNSVSATYRIIAERIRRSMVDITHVAHCFPKTDIATLVKLVYATALAGADHGIACRPDIAADISPERGIGVGRALVECFLAAVVGVQGNVDDEAYRDPFSDIQVISRERYLRSRYPFTVDGDDAHGGEFAQWSDSVQQGAKIIAMDIPGEVGSYRPYSFGESGILAIHGTLHALRRMRAVANPPKDAISEALTKFRRCFGHQGWVAAMDTAQIGRALAAIIRSYNTGNPEPYLSSIETLC